jgi:hypothetical protein
MGYPTPCPASPKPWPAPWSPSSAASPTISALLLTACGNSFQAVKPQIDASLPQPCAAAERLRVAKAYLDCKARHGALADRVK